jgi:glycosyltransferase involved in cell wall biosynthesis
MRILILDQFSDLGGAQLCLAGLMPALVEEGWQVHAAAPAGGLLTTLKRLGAEVHALPAASYSHGRKSVADAVRFGVDLPVFVRRVRALAAEAGPDVVYVNGPRLMPAVALAGLRSAVVFHSHNRIGSRVERALVRWAIRRSRASVIAASEYAAAQWESARVIYSGVEGPVTARPRDGTLRSAGMIGRISPQKRQKEFVAACRQLSKEGAALQFVVCGAAMFADRRTERYEQELRSPAVAGLRFLGWQDDVYRVLGDLDLLVVPSRDEGGFPRVAMEAFAAGVPVLAHASGAVPEVIVEGGTGFLLRSGSAGEIAGRIRELAADPAAVARAAGAGRELWRERFTVERFRREVCGFLRRCARSG